MNPIRLVPSLFDPSHAHAAAVGAAAATAFVTGLSGSAHCALMCGPLACAATPVNGHDRRRALFAWQAGRFLAYVATGALLGLAGVAATRALTTSVHPYLPWLMAIGLLATAFDLGRHLPALPGMQIVLRGWLRRSARFSPALRAGAMGAATPFLPCGLLYGVFLTALGTGFPGGGAIVMGAFAAGGMPALLLVQGAHPWLGRRPRALNVLRRVVPVMAAAVLVWRALHGDTGSTSCH